MAIDPATAKLIAQAAAKIVTDKETRNKILYVLLGGLAGLVVIIMIPLYLLTHPIEAIKIALGGGHADQAQIEQFKQDNDDKVLILSDNILWNEGAKYPMPLNGTVTSGYGDRNDPVNSGATEFHKGIDIQGQWHAQVIAIADGVIQKINTAVSDYGNHVLIKHTDTDGTVFYSFYAHLSTIYMFEGQSVKQGAVIGLEGGDPEKDSNPGSTTAHHLHFEIRTPGTNDITDPGKYILKQETESSESGETNG